MNLGCVQHSFLLVTPSILLHAGVLSSREVGLSLKTTLSAWKNVIIFDVGTAKSDSCGRHGNYSI